MPGHTGQWDAAHAGRDVLALDDVMSYSAVKSTSGSAFPSTKLPVMRWPAVRHTIGTGPGMSMLMMLMHACVAAVATGTQSSISAQYVCAAGQFSSRRERVCPCAAAVLVLHAYRCGRGACTRVNSARPARCRLASWHCHHTHRRSDRVNDG